MLSPVVKCSLDTMHNKKDALHFVDLHIAQECKSYVACEDSNSLAQT